MKLPQENQTAMAEDTGEGDGEFEALDDGYYLAKVEKISMSAEPGASGFHYWTVLWRVQRPKAVAKRTLYDRLSLSPKAAFKMREFFDALGFTYDSDTDELIGETAVLEVSQSEITSGKRKGEMGNDIEQILDAQDPENKALIAG